MFGILINVFVIILGTVCAGLGVLCFIRENGTNKGTHISIMMLGLFAGLWCFGYGIMGFCETKDAAQLWRYIGVISVNGYLLNISIMLTQLVKVNKPLKIATIVIALSSAVSDCIIMADDHGHHMYDRTDGRMAYIIISDRGSSIHVILMMCMFVTIFIVAAHGLFGKHNTLGGKTLLIMFSGHIFLAASMIFDTILPAQGYFSFPSSCFGISVAYFSFYYYCRYYNIFNINVQNVSDYIFQSGNENIIILGLDGKVIICNNTAQQLFGSQDMTGKTLSDMFDISEDVAENTFNDIKSGKINDFKLKTKSEHRSCSLRFTTALNKRGIPYCVVLFIYDLTEEEEMMSKLRKANLAKTEFLSNMSHEIRTPLNAVIGMNEMILREATDKNLLEYASSVHNSANILLSLINDILDISRIEAGRIDITKTDYDLSSLITDCYEMISETAVEKGLELNVMCSEDLPAKINGDIVHIRQIVTNLLSNAVKYTEKGHIDLTVTGQQTSSAAYMLKFIVRDTGIGIKSEDMPNLFGKFNRFDAERNRNIEGSGLGLSITRSLTRMLGGHITADSIYGKGSVFTAAIPIKAISSETIGEFDIKRSISDRKIEKYETSLYAPNADILVVDDVEINIKVFRSLMKETKANIDSALSGYEAIKLACFKKYDIIFMDHMMPGMDGLETYKILNNTPENMNADTPVIMLTANALSGMAEIYRENGFAYYITKPLDTNKLFSTVRKFLPKDKQQPRTAAKTVNTMTERAKAADSVTPKTDVSRLKGTALLKEILPDTDTDKALKYCGGSEELYIDILGDYANNGRKERIEKYYADKDWKRYAIEVHTLKSTSRTLGFMKLGDISELMQKAAEEEDTGYIEENHDTVVKEFERVLDAVSKILK